MSKRVVKLSVDPETLARTAAKRHKTNRAELSQNDLLSNRLVWRGGGQPLRAEVHRRHVKRGQEA